MTYIKNAVMLLRNLINAAAQCCRESLLKLFYYNSVVRELLTKQAATSIAIKANADG